MNYPEQPKVDGLLVVVYVAICLLVVSFGLVAQMIVHDWFPS